MRMNYTDGSAPFEFEITTPNMVAWERYARQNRLPITQGAPDFPQFEFMAYISYDAARTAGRIPLEMPFATYMATCGMPAPSAGDPGAEDETADPT